VIIHDDNYMIVSKSSNDINDNYWDDSVYPDWAAVKLFRFFPEEKAGHGVEPHYHDGDEIWLFTAGRGAGRGEVWLNDQIFEITPNTVVYTPMGVVHRFQMFRDFETAALVTRLERQRRATHIYVEEAGPPEPTVPGFVVPGSSNDGPIPDPGERCPLSELRQIAFAPGEGVDEAQLDRNEHWLPLAGTVHLTVDGLAIELAPGDVALLRAGAVRRLQSETVARVALARERGRA
jgi:mannose-6-phosphate isomerase-like protein (cupin superfamily)